MQAVGMVNDHLADCFRRAQLAALPRPVLRLNSGEKVNSWEIDAAYRLLAVLACLPGMSAHSQEGDPDAPDTVATPRLVDPNYRGAVLLAVPVDNNRHVGVIINRPTGRSLSTLFPEHAPSKLVRDPVYFGGPMLPQRSSRGSHRHTPGPGSIQMMKELFLAIQGAVVDHIIERRQRSALLRRLCRLAAGERARRSTGFGTCSRPTPGSCSARIARDSGKSCCGVRER